MSRVVSREQYFDAALEILAQSGFKGLNIGVLCRNLGVTSGSFYHHFGSWQGFVDVLLEFWENRQGILLRNLDFGKGEPETDLELLGKLTEGLNHKAEAAIRAWAANDRAVNAVLERVDDARRKTVGKTIRRIVGDRETAKVLASMGMSLLVGYQQLLAQGRQESLNKQLDEYGRLIYSHRQRSRQRFETQP